jgi:O-methyltransferase involved in polyketide biosynthesis
LIILAARVAAAGEPFQLFLDPAEVAEFLEGLGFNDREDLTRDGINARYGLKLRGPGHLIRSGSR